MRMITLGLLFPQLIYHCFDLGRGQDRERPAFKVDGGGKSKKTRLLSGKRWVVEDRSQRDLFKAQLLNSCDCAMPNHCGGLRLSPRPNGE